MITTTSSTTCVVRAAVHRTCGSSIVRRGTMTTTSPRSPFHSTFILRGGTGPKQPTTTATSRMTPSTRPRSWPTNNNNSSLSRRQATASNPKSQSQSSRQKATLAENAANESGSSSSAAAQQGGSSFPSFLPHNMNVFLNQPRTVPIPRWVSPRHYSTTLSESFGHASFILVAASYAVDDFLQLRIIAVAGSTAMLVFTYFHPHGRVLWLPFKWNLLFIAINGYRIGKVYLDQWRAQSMSGEMRRIHDQHFYVMKLVDFSRLVRMGEKVTFQQGQEIIQQGDPNKYIYLVLGGKLDVLRDGMITYNLTEGNFISELGLHAGLLLRGKIDSCCTIIASSEQEVCLLRWNRTELVHLLEIDGNIRRTLKAVLSWDIVSKLKSQRFMVTSGQVVDAQKWTQLRREQSADRYAGILHNMLSHPQYLKQRKVELYNYRQIHHIDDKEHEKALAEVGWTLAEFDAGTKEGQVEEVEEEVKVAYGLKWYLQELYLRLLG